MGYKPKRNISAHTRELDYFLYDLCVIWGFCLVAESHYDILNKKKVSAKELAHEVLKAEGMDPEYSEWTPKIIRLFEERFGGEFITEISFTDRVRGKKESW